MKRTILQTTLFLAAVIGLAVVWRCYAPAAPRYKAIRGTAKFPPTLQATYDYLYRYPFTDGKIWIFVSHNDERNCYLFDIDQRQVLGELFGADPAFTSSDGKTLICRINFRESERSFRETLINLLDQVIPGSTFLHATNEIDEFWSIDLQSQTAQNIGQVIQKPYNSGMGVRVSPHRQFAYTWSTASTNANELILFQASRHTFERRLLPAVAGGWWDDTNIIIRTPQNELLLYDVNTRSNSFLLSFSYLAEFFEEVGLTNAPQDARPFLQWDGTNTVVYLTEADKRLSAEESYLIRMECPEPMLKLISKNFKFEWSDHFDQAGTKYLYSGRDFGTNSDAVFMRDLKTGVTNTLVPSIGANCFSNPQFYKDSVIYVRSNELWQVNLTTSNTTRLFPPQQ